MAVAIRDRIKEAAQPLLEPGEMIQAVIPAQTKNGWLGALGIIWLIFTNRYRPIVVTDHRIAITDSGKYAMAKRKSIVASLPRSHPDRACFGDLVEEHQPWANLVRPQAVPQRRRASRLPAPRRLTRRLRCG